MNDEPDLELEAASAYLDGLATADEHELVEASPLLQADVDTFASIRSRLGDVDVPASARATAIATALSEFDRLRSPGATSRALAAEAHSATVVTLESRRRHGMLLAAAAAVVLLTIGAVIANVAHDSGDGASSADTIAPAAATTAKLPAPVGSSGAADTADDTADETDDETDAPAAGATPGPTIGAIPRPGDVLPTIESPAELLDFVMGPRIATAPAGGVESAAPATAAADTEVPATETPSVTEAASEPTTTDAPASTAALPEVADAAADCRTTGTAYLGRVIYRGRQAHVVEVLGTGEIRAFAVDDCELLASVVP